MSARRLPRVTGDLLSESTIGGIKAVLDLYDRRQLTLESAIDEIVTLVRRDHTHRQ